ncbi:unnamed protein product, partial [Urochloa humidicola]
LRSVLRRGGAAGRQVAWEDGAVPRDLLRHRVAERERARRRRRDPGRDEFFVPTPESLAWLDSASLPMVLTAAAVALFTKLLMMNLQIVRFGHVEILLQELEKFLSTYSYKDRVKLLQINSPQEHEATDQERRERKIKNSHPDQGKVRMLSREEWEEVQEVRPRTPFESKLAHPHARIRTGEPMRLEDVKDWATDVTTDAFTRVEESTMQK